MTSIRRALLLLFAALVAAGCDNTVDPFMGDPPSVFSISGYLDADADTQFVRVGAVRAVLSAAAETFDASVTTTDAETGVRTAWRDSLVRLDDGTQGHLFHAAFRPVPGRRYTLTVEGADGRTAVAFTDVPGPLDITPGDLEAPFGGDLRQTVTWRGLRRAPEDVTVRYVVHRPEAARPDTVRLSYTPFGEAGPAGLSYTVFLARDRRVVLSRLDREQDDSTVVLVEVGMAIRRLSDAWYAPPDASHVFDGFGFFGSAATVEASWRLDSLAAARVGYRAPAE